MKKETIFGTLIDKICFLSKGFSTFEAKVEVPKSKLLQVK